MPGLENCTSLLVGFSAFSLPNPNLFLTSWVSFPYPLDISFPCLELPVAIVPHSCGSERSGPHHPLLHPPSTLSRPRPFRCRPQHLLCCSESSSPGRVVWPVPSNPITSPFWLPPSHHPCPWLFLTWPSLFTLISLGVVSVDIPVDGNSVFLVVEASHLDIIFGSSFSYSPHSTHQETLRWLRGKRQVPDLFPLPPLPPPRLGLRHCYLSLGYRMTTYLAFLLLWLPPYSAFSTKQSKLSF